MVLLESMVGVPAAEQQSAVQRRVPGAVGLSASRQSTEAGAASSHCHTGGIGRRLCRQTPRCFRAIPWWLLIQNWATLRLSDHRGIDPASVRIDATGFSALLTRSKRIGEDKAIVSRPHVIDH